MIENVVTYGGRTVSKDKCKKIGGTKGYWYIVGDPKVKDSGECYMIHSNTAKRKVAYRLHTGKITWDYRKEEYVIKDQNVLRRGIVGVKDSGSLIMGHYSQNLAEHVMVRIGKPSEDYNSLSLYECPNKKVAEEFCKYNPIDGYYYLKSYLGSYNPKKTRYYTAKNDLTMYPLFVRSYSYAQQNKKYLKENYIEKYDNVEDIFRIMEELFKEYTTGIEIETFGGRAEQLDMLQHGFVPVKDGSINGIEYVSTIFNNKHDYKNLYEFAKKLNEYHAVDDFCSVHVHVGNILEKKTKEERKLFIIAAYMFMAHIQREIWEFLPKYKKEYTYLNKKRGKDHCQDLYTLNLFYNKIINSDKSINNDELNKAFNSIFTFMNDGQKKTTRSNYETRVHRKGQVEKWNYESRYYNTNFFNMFFTDINTIEFRHHSGTTNPHKLIAWTIICLAMVKFIDTNTHRIIAHKEKFNLFDVIDSMRNKFGAIKMDNIPYTELSKRLNEYIIERKTSFIEAFYNDDIYNGEFNNDRKYVPKQKFI